MFVGHYSTALLARRLEPRLPLWVLFVAAQLVDVFWALFIMVEVERVRIVPGFTETNPLDLHYMPFTHSLIPATLAWAALAALAWRLLRPGDGARAAVMLGLVVASHWVLDVPMHRPDLPLVWNCCKVGFGLWNDRIMSLIVELGLLLGATALAASAVPRRTRLWSFAALLAVFQLVNVFGPQVSTSGQMAVMALLFYALLAAGAAWVDRPAGRTG